MKSRSLCLLCVMLFLYLVPGFTFACKNPVDWVGWKTPTDFYSYQVTYRGACGFLGLDCCTKSIMRRRVEVGIGAPQWQLDSVWKPNGCGGTPMLQGDQDNWRVACNVHDIMYATVPPDGTDDEEWRRYADQALMLNMAHICQNIWPVASPGLGGCFDGARHTYKVERNFGRAAFDTAQKASKKYAISGSRKALSSISADDYRALKKYVDDAMIRWPLIGTSWNAGRGFMNPD